MLHHKISPRLLALPAILLTLLFARGLAASDDVTEFHEIDVKADVRPAGPTVVLVDTSMNFVAVGDCNIILSDPDDVATPVLWTFTLIDVRYKMSQDGPWIDATPGVDYVTNLTQDDCVGTSVGDTSHVELPFTFRPISPGYWNIKVTVSAFYDEEPNDQSVQGSAPESPTSELLP